MERYRISSIAAVSIITIGLAMVLHECGHVLTGWMLGGRPTLLSTTEVLGDFDSLSPWGFVLFGASGSIVNLIFCAFGWWVLKRRPATAELRLAAWFFFAANGFLVTTKMMGEAIAGFGDWMTILHSFPAVNTLRIVVAILGTAGVALLVRRTGAELARILPPGDPSLRAAEARRIIGIGAAAAFVLALGGGIASPIPTTRAILLSAGAVTAPFLPMLFGIRFLNRASSEQVGALRYAGWPWTVAAGVVAVVMWFVVGPGINLSAPSA